MKVDIYQIYHKEECVPHLDEGFIPFSNLVELGLHWENDIIRRLYESGKHKECDFIGTVSWRFFEKTGIKAVNVLPLITGEHKVYSLSPEQYYKVYPHVFSVTGFAGVQHICNEVDNAGILPMKISGYDGDPIFCNYWVTTPEIFEHYVTTWLIPCMDFIASREDFLEVKELHRNKMMIASVFMLEGLFSCYCFHHNIAARWITKGFIMDKINSSHRLIRPICKQIDELKSQGIMAKVILMSTAYEKQLRSEFPIMFPDSHTGVHSNVILIDGVELGLYINPIEENYIKVMGDRIK